VKVHSLYKDFFRFLSRIRPQSDKWALYDAHYYKIHKDFLETYFSHFPLIDFSNLKERVEAIRPSDYSQQGSIISVCPPEPILKEAYKRCTGIVPSKRKPDVYLFIGFFSPDGFVMDFKGKPIICFGLERFKDFDWLKILFAHEYTHYLLNLSRGEVPEDEKFKWLLLSEGMCTFFSQLAIPEYKLPDHFLFQRDRLNWCQKNEPFLRKIYCSGKYSTQQLFDFYKNGNSELDLPPRAGKYLGFLAVKNYLGQHKNKDMNSLVNDNKTILSLNL
jgi:hypothetical protein